MADEKLKKKIHNVLKRGRFKDPGDLVDVSDGEDDENIHLVIVSQKFNGLGLKEKNNLIWDELAKNLSPKEWGTITLSIGTSPQEIKAS